MTFSKLWTGKRFFRRIRIRFFISYVLFHSKPYVRALGIDVIVKGNSILFPLKYTESVIDWFVFSFMRATSSMRFILFMSVLYISMSL